MKKFLNLLLTIALIMMCFSVFPQNIHAASKSDSIRLFNLINDYRASNGLSKMQWHESSYVVAYNHTVDMHNTQQLSHELHGKGPGDRLKEAGIEYKCYVENVAFNSGHADPVQSAFNQWKTSKGHNENMLSDCCLYGSVAIVSSDAAGWYFTFLALTPKKIENGPGDQVGDTIRQSMKNNEDSPIYTVTWTNTGDTNLNVRWKVDYDGNTSGWLIVTPQSHFLAPGQSGNFEFYFDAKNLSKGVYNAKLTFYHEGGSQITPVELTITGEGTLNSGGSGTVELWIDSDIMRVNGQTKRLDAPPTIISGRTVVPVRAISEAFGAEVGWEGSEKKITVVHGANIIEMWVNSKSSFVNSQMTSIDPPPSIINGRTFVPFRFIGEALGADVSWDGNERKVTLVIN